jgi:putative acetyltransferase
VAHARTGHSADEDELDSTSRSHVYGRFAGNGALRDRVFVAIDKMDDTALTSPRNFKYTPLNKGQKALMIPIRHERRRDIGAVRIVNERAFGLPEEADIVDQLRKSCGNLLSLVATRGKMIVGHILFSPVIIGGGDRVIEGMGLAPMAVLPEYQRQGIGSALVESGLATLRDRSCAFVTVLGHPEYYPRFGFERASMRGIRCQWDGVPDEAFMILVLDPSVMKGVSGVATYRDEFNPAM